MTFVVFFSIINCIINFVELKEDNESKQKLGLKDLVKLFVFMCIIKPLVRRKACITYVKKQMKRSKAYLDDASNRSNTLYYKKEKKKYETARKYFLCKPEDVAFYVYGGGLGNEVDLLEENILKEKFGKLWLWYPSAERRLKAMIVDYIE